MVEYILANLDYLNFVNFFLCGFVNNNLEHFVDKVWWSRRYWLSGKWTVPVFCWKIFQTLIWYVWKKNYASVSYNLVTCFFLFIYAIWTCILEWLDHSCVLVRNTAKCNYITAAQRLQSVNVHSIHNRLLLTILYRSAFNTHLNTVFLTLACLILQINLHFYIDDEF